MTQHRFVAGARHCARAQHFNGQILDKPMRVPVGECTRKRTCKCEVRPMAPTGEAEVLAQCIAAGSHLKTLVAGMHRRGISATVAEGTSHNGLPFIAIVAHGPWVDLARQVGDALVAEIAARKLAARGN